MPDVFITLEEAAAFEGITYEAMKKRVQRSPEQHNVKSQAREGGGKDQVLISTSSLSAKARKAWRAAQKVEGSEVIIDKRAQEAVPWYVTADLNQYQWTTPAPHRGGRRQLRHQRPCILLQQERDRH